MGKRLREKRYSKRRQVATETVAGDYCLFVRQKFSLPDHAVILLRYQPLVSWKQLSWEDFSNHVLHACRGRCEAGDDFKLQKICRACGRFQDLDVIEERDELIY